MSRGKTLLCMGSKAFGDKELPPEVKAQLDSALTKQWTILVGEAPGANRAFQDYLCSKGYQKVIVGHARSIRYNAGNWTTTQYGDNVTEREKGMIDACDEALIIWVNHSSVIATNLERLKLAGKPTFLYEYLTRTHSSTAGPLDSTRIYDPNYHKYRRY
ncbi:MAG: hypothetical protein ACFE89_01285 [Candidatus Hodarchaeota archaeon]